MNINGRPNLDTRETVGHSIGQVARDLIALVELQLELARSDARNAIAQTMRPWAALLGAVGMGLMAMPILLMAAAEYLVFLGLLRPAGYAIVAGGVLAISLAIGAAASSKLRKGSDAFRRSRDEMARNVAWLKNVVQDFAQKNDETA